MHLGVGRDRQLFLAERQVGLAILQIVASAYLALSLIDSVHELLAIELRDKIECTFGRHLSLHRRPTNNHRSLNKATR
jgi:hypothetical protein